jgi:predicted amidohydrolase
MRVAAIQFTPEFQASQSNWSEMLRLAERETAELLVFPELASCGYRYERRGELAPYVNTVSALGDLRTLARRTGQIIIGGFAETARGGWFNSVFIISSRVRIYRKIHLWDYETRLFRPGERLLVVSTRGHRIGVEICYDLQFPEQAVALASRGAEMLVVPMAWPADSVGALDGLQPYSHLAMATAYSLGIPVVVCNRTGTERGTYFPGESSITDAFGRQQRLGPDPGVLRAELDLRQNARARRPNPRNDLLRDRRMSVRLARVHSRAPGSSRR